VNDRQIQEGYTRTLGLAREIATERLAAHIDVPTNREDAIDDLAQSIVGTEQGVRLITSLPFDREAYYPVLVEAADEVGRLFFPDVRKRFISSIDDVPEAALASTEIQHPSSDDIAPRSPVAVANLPDDLRSYLDDLMSRQGIDRLSSRLWRESNADTLAARLIRLRRHYPDAVFTSTFDGNVEADLTDDSIREAARRVASGLTPTFPWSFFTYQTSQRTAIATEYIVRTEIRREPKLLVHEGVMPFVALGLGPALRRCGGSVNRLLAHAFPDTVRPWMSSHVPTGFWEDQDNRRDAVRWLVEDELGVSQTEIAEAVHEGRISKSEFAGAGMTWLLKEVYRWSVSDALGEAYPELEPWERLRRVPTEMWKGPDGRQTASRAISWALNRNGIAAEELRHQKAARALNAALRPWKLTAAYDTGFERDIVLCLETVFPGTFQPWEITNVSRDTWRDPILRKSSFEWLLDQLGIAEAEIPIAIAEGRLSPAQFGELGLDGLLRVTGSVWRAVCDVFPERFARWELSSVPRSYWRSRANVREAVIWAIERLDVSIAEVPAAIDDGRISSGDLVSLGLSSLVMGVFHGDLTAMCQVADVLPAEKYVPLSRYYRKSMQRSGREEIAWGLDPSGHARNRDRGVTNELDRHVARVSQTIHDRRRRRAK
jgi:hypothetical protein